MKLGIIKKSASPGFSPWQGEVGRGQFSLLIFLFPLLLLSISFFPPALQASDVMSDYPGTVGKPVKEPKKGEANSKSGSEPTSWWAKFSKDPVNQWNGAFTVNRTDLVLKNREASIHLKFSYQSNRAFNHRWGYGWAFNYDYTYDAIGNATSRVTRLGGVTAKDEFSYDARDRLVSENLPVLKGWKSIKSVYDYDLSDNRVKRVTTRDGLAPRETTYGVNTWNEIVSAKSQGGSTLMVVGTVNDDHGVVSVEVGAGGKTVKAAVVKGEFKVEIPVVGDFAHESKVGYTSLTPAIQTQILKDAELVDTGVIKGSTWHFFESPITGQGGPSRPLLNALQENKFKVIIH